MERSLEATGSNGNADIPPKTRKSWSKDKNNHSARDVKVKRQRSRSEIENLRQNKARNHQKISNMSLDDLSRLCKPLCVHLTRLPVSTVNKCAPLSGVPAPEKKKKRLFRWKYGALARKTHRRSKLSLSQIKTSQHQQLPAQDRINGRVEASVPDLNSNSNRFTPGTTLSSGGDRAEEINQTEERNEGGDICGFTPHEQTISAGQEYELSWTTEANEASRSPDQTNNPNLSKKYETHIRKSADEPQSTTGNTTPASLEQDNNANHKISLRANNDHEIQVNFKQAEKRRLSPNDNDVPKERKRSQPSKKYKCSPTVSYSERVTLAEERNSSISEDDVAFVNHEQILPRDSKRHDSKSIASRRKSNRTHLNTAMIVVNRLDSSHSPLVQKWKDKVRLPKVDDATLISSVTRPMKTLVACPSNEQLQEESRLDNSTATCSNQNVSHDGTSNLLTRSQENDVHFPVSGTIQIDTNTVTEVNPSRPPEGELLTHIETIMCDSNDDEDDDEIMEFLSTRRRVVRPSIDSSSSESISDVQEPIKTKSSRTNVKTPSSSEDLSHHKRKKSPSMSRAESRKIPSLRTRRTMDWIDNSNSESKSSRDEVRTPPITRSKSRAAMDNANYKRIFSSNEDLTDHTRECGTSYDPYEPLTHYESNEIENLHASGSRGNTQNSTEFELSRENDNSREALSRVHSDILRLDLVQMKCSNKDGTSKKQTIALKRATVVLTRIEDSLDLSGDKEYPRGKMKFKANGFGFLAYFNHETVENDDIDLRSNESGLSNLATDPLGTEYSLANQTSNSVTPFPQTPVNPDASSVTDSCRKKPQQDPAIIARNGRNLQDRPENKCSQESVESEVELSLFLDEEDNASPESMSRNLIEDILTNPNSSNDRSIRTPGAPCPEDLDENCKRCHCEEHHREHRRLKCQNLSPTHKCITCNSLFKDSEQLEQHRTTNAFCNSGFRCTVCKTNYMTLIELAKHRVVCAEKGMPKRNSVDQVTNQESTTESRPAESTVSEPPQSKNKPKKHSQKNSSKQGRSRPRCRVDHLTCSVCSTNFETRTDLSEHIFKHSAEELQEAYRVAKAKAMADSQVASEERKKNECRKNLDQLADSQVVDGKTTVGVEQDEMLPQNFITNPAQAIISSIGSIVTTTVNNDSLQITSATVCLCHRDNDQSPVDRTDLQIEMVLLCKYCHVLFRRRECIELHYRTSSRCASDRKRERWARLFCANCQLTLNSWADMRQHLEVHARQNAEGTVRFVCNICRVVFVGFGALFYNHWFNHLKDTMFVAGRYNFPKVSVQPIDGSEKLPAGARSDESYIFVAEHVCVSCKKPFSTRRDLEIHMENTSSCRKNNLSLEVGKCQSGNDVTRFSCDVCNLTFSDRKALNDHGKTGHDHRFIHVNTSLSLNSQNFMCTHCHVTKKSVRALEEHWKTHLLGNSLPSSVETARSAESSEAIAKESVLVSSSVDDDQILKNRSLTTCDNHAKAVTPTTQTQTANEPTVITIDDEDSIIDNVSVFQVTIETPVVQNIHLENQVSSVSVPSITSSESNAATTMDSTTLNDFLKKAPLLSKAIENHRAEVRALEDSCANAMLSEETSTNASASSALSGMCEKSQEKSVDDTNTDSYVLLSNHTSPRNIKMVLGRRHPANIAENCTSPPMRNPSSEVIDKTITDDSISASGSQASANVVTTLAVIQNSGTDKTIEHCLNAGTDSNTKGKENSYSPKVVKNDKSNVSPSSLLKDRAAIPEIIEIIDEVEEIELRETASNDNNAMEMQHSHTDSPKKKKGNTDRLREAGNSGSTELDKILESIKIDTAKPHSAQANRTSNSKSPKSETCSNSSGNGTTVPERSNFYSRATKASTMSFEEARWMFLKASTNPNDIDSAASQKQGFLRVKNLSELRAVKTHTCLSCDARFESRTSLTEHQQVHICGVLDKDIQYPKGITAALVLPDSSERPKTPEDELSRSDAPGSISMQPLRQLLTTHQTSYASSRLAGVLSNQGVAANTHAQNIVLTGDSIGWMHVGTQQAPVTSIPRVETANTLQNVSLVMDLGSQQQVNNPMNNALSNPILISSTGITQTQDNLAGQQPQPIISSVGTIVMPETNQRLHENRTGTIGYHVLPPMVVLPTSQTTKQQQRNVARPISSSNYLPTSGSVNNSPITYQSEGVNKLLCNICHTFQCDNLEAFNRHVTKHYTGWNKTMPQNSIQIATSATTTPSVPTTTSFSETTRRLMPNDTNQIGNRTIFNNWTVKDTPQGPLLVTPVSASISEQSMTSFVLNNNRSILRPAPPNTTNNSPILSNSGQIVYRCMICKSAVYKNYPPLRNHVILVHGITDFASRGVENIVQKSYHCTLCPTTTALFDSEEKFRTHVDTVHTHSCPSCRRVFVSFLSLKSHLEHCRNTYGNKC